MESTPSWAEGLARVVAFVDEDQDVGAAGNLPDRAGEGGTSSGLVIDYGRCGLVAGDLCFHMGNRNLLQGQRSEAQDRDDRHKGFGFGSEHEGESGGGVSSRASESCGGGGFQDGDGRGFGEFRGEAGGDGGGGEGDAAGAEQAGEFLKRELRLFLDGGGGFS